MKKVINFLFLCMFGVAIGAAHATQKPTVIKCVHPSDKALTFSYFESKVKTWNVFNSEQKVYLIDTIGGKQIAINSLALEQYKCEKVVR